MDFPLTIDINRLINGGPCVNILNLLIFIFIFVSNSWKAFKDLIILCRIIKYDKEGYARIGVMPRDGNADSVQWFEVEKHCLFHNFNSFEDGNEVMSKINVIQL